MLSEITKLDSLENDIQKTTYVLLGSSRSSRATRPSPNSTYSSQSIRINLKRLLLQIRGEV